ncbi:melanocortin receptor 4-like [Mercenaria mercenaria]|uniref:melanocortin receptor 4-like n=1 Tax=Mercenaria mercenaria TaxID=6596 RepID=UPI00234ECF8D|nr:melanocortin receptor 4-like [Mercenaria mercenaria]
MEISNCQNDLINRSSACFNISTNLTKSGRAARNGKYACGYCDEKCVYSAIELGFTIGVLANLLVIVRVIRDRKLRDPSFIGIAALAVADLLFLTLNLTVSFETVIISYTCTRPVIISRPFYIMNSMCWFAANSHVALLAVIRYVSIARPVSASVFLRPARVILLSCCVWALGMILLGTLAGLITLRIIIPGTSHEFIIVWWITVYLLPLVVTIILHLLKIVIVRRSFRVSSAKETNRKLVQRMSTIVVMVIVMATVLPLPRLIFNCLRVVGNSAFPSKEFKTHFRGISHMLFLINHFINPFMYALMSRKFRHSLKEAFFCVRFRTSTTENSDTVESPLSSERRQTSLEMATQNTQTGNVTQNTPIESVTQNAHLESVSQNSPLEIVTDNTRLGTV